MFRLFLFLLCFATVCQAEYKPEFWVFLPLCGSSKPRECIGGNIEKILPPSRFMHPRGFDEPQRGKKTQNSGYKYNLAICAIFQDEAPYLKEWIEFHRLMGVEHFYLYNHRSRDHYKEVLRPYIAAGLVELIDKPKVANRIQVFNRLQCKCYTECLKQAKGFCKWIAFIDIDEYLFPVCANHLTEVLKEYENFGGLCVNWLVFGTSHIAKIPKEKLLIECLTLCTPKLSSVNRYIKSIVRPEYASHFPNPHHPIYLAGYYQVNTDKIPFEGPFFSSYIQTNKLRINHYWTRDEDFLYRVKIPRQKRWGGSPNAQDIIQGANAEKDEIILRFLKDLRDKEKGL